MELFELRPLSTEIIDRKNDVSRHGVCTESEDYNELPDLKKGVFQQEHAKVMHVNPKYIKSVSIFTTRHNRRSPYTTDLNITAIAAWGNNVTITILFNKHKAKLGDFGLDLKTCDMMKFKWTRDWVEKFSNMSVDTCPLKKGTYRFVGFEVPPKNFPIPIGHGDYKNRFLVYSTKTKERILEISMDLKFNEN